MLRLIDYIFPPRCVNCMRILSQDEMPICLNCYHALPFSNWAMGQDNPTFDAIYRNVDIVEASSLLLYQHDNAVKKLVMANKYYNQQNIGHFFAKLSKDLLATCTYDVLACVPSHSKTKRQRGYNQVELFAKHLSTFLNIPYDNQLIRRVKRRDSQTHKNKTERFKSLEKAFSISDSIQEYKRVLLLDDVLTTGATLSSCCQTMLQQNPRIDISVYTMAKVV